MTQSATRNLSYDDEHNLQRTLDAAAEAAADLISDAIVKKTNGLVSKEEVSAAIEEVYIMHHSFLFRRRRQREKRSVMGGEFSSVGGR